MKTRHHTCTYISYSNTYGFPAYASKYCSNNTQQLNSVMYEFFMNSIPFFAAWEIHENPEDIKELTKFGINLTEVKRTLRPLDLKQVTVRMVNDVNGWATCE